MYKRQLIDHTSSSDHVFSTVLPYKYSWPHVDHLGVCVYLLFGTPQVSLAIFITYIYTADDHYLRPEIAFVTLTFMSVIRVAVNTAPPMLSHLIKAAVSIGRLSRYLNQSELDTNNVCKDCVGSGEVKYQVSVFLSTYKSKGHY